MICILCAVALITFDIVSCIVMVKRCSSKSCIWKWRVCQVVHIHSNITSYIQTVILLQSWALSIDTWIDMVANLHS